MKFAKAISRIHVVGNHVNSIATDGVRHSHPCCIFPDDLGEVSHLQVRPGSVSGYFRESERTKVFSEITSHNLLGGGYGV